MLKKISLTLFFLSYALILIAVLLVVRFPKDTLISRLEQKIETELPGYTCDIDNIKYMYPFSVLFEGVTIIHSTTQAQLPFANILVTPDPKNLMSQFEASLEILGGTMKTEVILHPESRKIELPVLTISGINLKDVGFLEHQLGRGVTGIIELSGKYNGDRTDFMGGEFSGTVRLGDFQMELKRPILQTSEVVFDEVTTLFQMRNRLLEVVDGKAKGPFFDGYFTGAIKLKKLWRASSIALSGTISPKQEYLEKDRQVARAAALLYKKYKSSTIPYKLTGNLEDPIFAFGNN